MVLGVAMTISPFSVTMENMIDAFCVLGASVLCYIFSGTKKKIGKIEGAVFVVAYAVYLAYIIMRDVM